MSLCPGTYLLGGLVEVCIIGHNRLVNLYLTDRVCKDPALRCVRFEDLMQCSPKPRNRIVFLFDVSEMTIPLSRCMQTLSARFPEGKYLFVLNGASLDQVRGFLELGIDGLMEYEDVEMHLTSAVNDIVHGISWRSPSLDQSVRSAMKQLARKHAGDRSALTCREFDIVQLARQKMTNKEIASLLGIEESTVKFHFSNVFSKLNISTRDELLKPSRTNEALSRFLLDPPEALLSEEERPMRPTIAKRRLPSNYRGVAC